MLVEDAGFTRIGPRSVPGPSAFGGTPASRYGATDLRRWKAARSQPTG